MVFWFFKKKEDDKIDKIHKNMQNSFSNMKKDMGNVKSWIDHFHSKHEDHEENYQKLLKEMQDIKKIFENHVGEHHSKDERSIVHERVQSFNRSNQSFMNIQSLKDKITPAQKRILLLLNRTNIPLEYNDIAEELGLSIVTVRRHINDVKRSGFEIKEKVSVDTRRKVFYIENKLKFKLKSRK
ncbi:HTH domain-containing protein [archaeon]|nr:HTH domain-containing protein [archaeon]